MKTSVVVLDLDERKITKKTFFFSSVGDFTDIARRHAETACDFICPKNILNNYLSKMKYHRFNSKDRSCDKLAIKDRQI